MKKMIMLALALLLAVSPALAEGSITVLATTYPLYDIAKNVGGDDVTVKYDPEAAGDAQGADIVLCAGNEAESWGDATVLNAYDNVVAAIEGDYETTTIPINVSIVATAYCGLLNDRLPENYQERNEVLMAYNTAFLSLDSEIRTAITEGTTVTAADGSMAYFAQEYGIEESESGIELHTYTHPEEADQETPYLDLMRRNLDALKAAEN